MAILEEVLMLLTAKQDILADAPKVGSQLTEDHSPVLLHEEESAPQSRERQWPVERASHKGKASYPVAFVLGGLQRWLRWACDAGYD